MPYYQYKCGICDVRFEVSHPMTAVNYKIFCPNGHIKVSKILPTIQFVKQSNSTNSSSNWHGCNCAGNCGCSKS